MEEKNFITIELKKGLQETNYLVNCGLGDNKYDLVIEANPNNTYEQIKSNKKEIMGQLKEEMDLSKEQEPELFAASIDLADKILSGKVVLFEDIDSIQIEGEFEDIKLFLESSPELLNYKVLLQKVDDLDGEKLKRAYEYLGKFPNIYCYSDGNTELRSLEDLIKTVDKVDAIVNHVKAYDYSPFEILLHTYDIIRDRKYLKAKENEKYQVSRDLSQVLLGDEIVCEGYSNIYEAVVNKLGIPVRKIRLRSKDDPSKGHAVNAVYLKDDKYDIEGIFYIGVTEGRKVEGNDFLDSYLFFAKTKLEYEVFTQNKYNDETFPAMTPNLLNEIKQFSTLDSRIPEKYKKTFWRADALLGKTDFIYHLGCSNYEETMELIKKYKKLFNTTIDCLTFLKALIKVRKNEYYENPEKYPFSEDKLLKIVLNSAFRSNNYLTELLISKMFNSEKPSMFNCVKEEISEYSDEVELPKQIEQVKVAKVLRKVLESKTNK